MSDRVWKKKKEGNFKEVGRKLDDCVVIEGKKGSNLIRRDI